MHPRDGGYARIQRWVGALLCVVLLLGLLPIGASSAATGPLSLAELQAKYPHGTYWNHTKGGSEDYTTTPCSHHTGNCTYNGSCGCNSYKNVAIQCMGFAYQLAALAYDCDPRAEWSTYRDTSALDTLKAGDIVRYKNNSHSIFVTAVEGDAVTYADCNGDGHCKIQWNRSTTKTKLKSGFTYVKTAPYALSPAAELLTMTASAQTVQVGQEVTVTLTYDGGEHAIGALMGRLTYDAAAFGYLSVSGDNVEIHQSEGEVRYVYYAKQAQAPETLTIAFTFEAAEGGEALFQAVTGECVDDADYTSLGTPTESVAVTVTVPTLSVTYHGGGGTIDNRVVSRTYRVWSDNGINMRKDAGTSNGKVSALPYNTVFTVAAGDTKEADGYTWGKTTYNGKTGWVVISDFVDLMSTAMEGDWLLKDGVVSSADGTALCHAFAYGKGMAGLCVPDEVGLYREGYRFAGWNTAADGSGVTATADTLPQELCPDGDAVVLYALWNPIILGDADGDGKLNNRDLGLLQRYLNGWDVTLCPEADLNADGTLNNKDLGLLQLALNKE